MMLEVRTLITFREHGGEGYKHEEGFRGLVISVQFLDMCGVVTDNSLSYTLTIGVLLYI